MNRTLLRGRDIEIEAELSAGLSQYLLGIAVVVGLVGLFDQELFPENYSRILVLRYCILLPSLGVLAILVRSAKTEHAHFLSLFLILSTANFVQSSRLPTWISSAAW